MTRERKHDRMKKTAIRLLSALLAALLLWPGLSFEGPVRAAEETETEYIVKYREGAAPSPEKEGLPFDVVSGEELQGLLEEDLLEWYEPDGQGFLLETEEPAFYDSAQWNLALVRAEGAFARDCLGEGVRVGVVDSGISAHAALASCLAEGANYIENARNTTDTTDSFGHGTKVAGLIAGAGETGFIGTAPGAELVPLKVTDGSSVQISAICRAIYGGIDDFHCSVLNLSLGVSKDYQSLREAIEYAEAQNVVVVSAAGNQGSGTVYFPAGYDSVIGVGSVDENRLVAPHSNHNYSVFLTAPGLYVRTTSRNGGYSTDSGTSFSTPQVSGAAAVLLGAAPDLKAAEVRELLARTAGDLGDEGFDEYYGYGLLDLTAAVLALPEDPPEEEPETPCSFLGDDGPAPALRNNTEEPIDLIYLLAEYSGEGQLLGLQTLSLTLAGGETAELPLPAEAARYGQFVYASDTMAPLAPARKTPQQDPEEEGEATPPSESAA